MRGSAFFGIGEGEWREKARFPKSDVFVPSLSF